MKFRLSTKEFTGYFEFVEDVLDFMMEITRETPWELRNEETGEVIMFSSGGSDE